MSAVQTESREAPKNALGDDEDFLTYHLRTAFIDVRRLVGLDRAQNIMATIILDERKGNRND
jgi:hypothetical protein